MIFFRGVPIDSVAPVKIVDIMISPVSMNAVARERPIRAGSDFVRLTGRTRTVSVTFALLTNDLALRQRQLDALNKWAFSDKPEKLSFTLHNGYLTGICTAFPEPSTRQWWESKLRYTFTCFDPYWTSIAERSVNCGTAFIVNGDAPPIMRIENTLSESGNVTYTDGTDTMTFNGVPAGKLVVDLTNQTATVGNVSVMDKYTFDSRFIVPHTGATTITGAGTVHFRERWL
jgi:phage-related protein